ncbi:uncharacterized protein LOC134278146 [Saccostrea cucullata]|uniref:uncharacterized protein LOC134278146 n=1 Tax=Saccostrea cuccullata TaxID=36930 RepID=UPI002ED24532
MLNLMLFTYSDTAIQHISESVFVGLCHKLGTSQLVAMRRDVVDISEMVNNQVYPINGRRKMESGSQREGFRLEGSDTDMMYWPNNHRVIWELSQSQYYNTHRQTLILCDCSDSPPGFTLLYLLSPSMNRDIQRACVRMYDRYYISSSAYRHMFCSNRIPHGPCASAKFLTVEFDFAYCLACDFWPPSASSWIDRCHLWPQPHVVEDVVKNGCHFVAVGHKLGNYEEHEWRISFSLAEQKLVNAMNHCQFLTYGLLKLFLTEVINNGLGDDDKLLCSYHMKTTVFWVIQQNTIPHWCPQNLLECFWVCFKLILKWVYEGACPNFFIPENNMFLSKIHGEKQRQLFLRLYGLYERGLAFLLHSPSIRSCIVNVLHNPRLSIGTDEHTLIAEHEFDRNLYCEIGSNEIFYFFNIQMYMRCLHTIEQMIHVGSPLITQYNVPMLQKLTSTLLHKTAFIVYMETYTHKNKLRYRADRISCHMLKLAAKFGFISDRLYIAMYYYKTLRYTEAVSILEMIEDMLARPYTMYMYNFNIGPEMYPEAVRGQSWSLKMRQTVAWSNRLYHEIHYISELIPEQQSAQQNKDSALDIPPFILLYMLEILCYKHVDTMRAQAALDDLQTLVHYEEGRIIPLIYRDISWRILEICQQEIGDI